MLYTSTSTRNLNFNRCKFSCTCVSITFTYCLNGFFFCLRSINLKPFVKVLKKHPSSEDHLEMASHWEQLHEASHYYTTAHTQQLPNTYRNIFPLVQRICMATFCIQRACYREWLLHAHKLPGGLCMVVTLSEAGHTSYLLHTGNYHMELFGRISRRFHITRILVQETGLLGTVT